MVGEVLPPHIRLGWHCRTHFNHYTIRTDIHIELEFGQMVVVVVALPVFRARRSPFVLDLFLLPISFIAFQLSYGVLVSVHCYHARGPRFDPGTWRCYELFICKVQFSI